MWYTTRMDRHKSTKTITVRLPVWAIEWLKERAGEREMPVSTMVAQNILAGIEQTRQAESD